MQSLFESGAIIELLLAFVALEALLLFAIARRGRGLRPRDFLYNLAAGAALMLGLRAALTGQPWTCIGAWLGLALVFHVLDLAGRWPRRRC